MRDTSPIPNTYIISAPEHRMVDLQHDLAAATQAFIRVRSSYKGEEEDSILVVDSAALAGPALHDLMRELGAKYDQESVLHILPSRQAYLVWTDGKDHSEASCTGNPYCSDILGEIKPVDKWRATQEDGWTYRPDIDQYYIIEPVS